jgi:endogenous inhibitor of DNA gyrase (YacG/DUF329 family)
VIRYGCPVCNKQASVVVGPDYDWSCPTCKATGHWTLHLTAHPLAGSRPKR